MPIGPAPTTSATVPDRGPRADTASICSQAFATMLPGSVNTPRSPSWSGTLMANPGSTRQRVAP